MRLIGPNSTVSRVSNSKLYAKELIKKLKLKNPDIEHHIFRSVWNVDLKHLISYHLGDEKHCFMDNYDDDLN